MRSLQIGCISIALFGCGVMAPPHDVTETELALSYKDTVEFLTGMTSRCWASSASPLKDGIALKRFGGTDTRGFTIEGYRTTLGTGAATEPFIVVAVTALGSEAVVQVHERDFGKGLVGPFHLGAAAHVRAWLHGSRDCKLFSLGVSRTRSAEQPF